MMFGHISKINDKMYYFPLINKKTFKLTKKDYDFKNFNNNSNDFFAIVKNELDSELNMFVDSIIQEFSKIQEIYKFQNKIIKVNLKKFKFNIENTKLISFGLKKKSFHNLAYELICIEQINASMLGITIFENDGNTTISLKLVPNEIYYNPVNNIKRKYYIENNEFDIEKFDYNEDKQCFTYLDFNIHNNPCFLIKNNLDDISYNKNIIYFTLECNSFVPIKNNIQTKFKTTNSSTNFINARMFTKNSKNSLNCYINGIEEIINIKILLKYKLLKDICHFNALIKPYIFNNNGSKLLCFTLQKLFIDININIDNSLITPSTTVHSNYVKEYYIFDKPMLHTETLRAYGFPAWDKFYYNNVKQFQKLFILFPYYEQNSIVKTMKDLKTQLKDVDIDKVIVKIGEQKLIKIFIDDVYNLMENFKFINNDKFKTEEDAKKMLIKYFSKTDKFNIYYKFAIKKIYNPETKKPRKALFLVANFNKVIEQIEQTEQIKKQTKIEEMFKNVALEI